MYTLVHLKWHGCLCLGSWIPRSCCRHMKVGEMISIICFLLVTVWCPALLSLALHTCTRLQRGNMDIHLSAATKVSCPQICLKETGVLLLTHGECWILPEFVSGAMSLCSWYWESPLNCVSWFNPSQQLSTTQPLTHCPPTPGMGERIRKKKPRELR